MEKTTKLAQSPSNPASQFTAICVQRVEKILQDAQPEMNGPVPVTSIVRTVRNVLVETNVACDVLKLSGADRDVFRKTTGRCLRALADQLDPPPEKSETPEVDPLTVYVQHVSSNVEKTSYDPNKLILEVVFKSGLRYRYDGVPQETREQMLAAASVGKFINASIKGAYNFEQVK